MKAVTTQDISGTDDAPLFVPEGTIVEITNEAGQNYATTPDGVTFPVQDDEWEVPSSFKISGMNCYAGKWRAEVSDFSPRIHDEPGVYCQFVEGCGYNVYTLTPDEAELLGQMLLKAAEETRTAFAAKVG